MVFAPGSSGQVTFITLRTAGLCLVPFGSDAGVEATLRGQIEGAGFAVTNFEGINGIPGHRCDALVTFGVPASSENYFGQAPMGIGPIAVGVMVAVIALSLAILAWSIQQLVLAFVRLVEIIAPPGSLAAIGIGLLLLGGGLLLVTGAAKKGRDLIRDTRRK